MSRPSSKFPVRCKERSYGHYAEGVCYGLGFDANGRPIALLEYERGRVQVLRLDGPCWIELVRDEDEWMEELGEESNETTR